MTEKNEALRLADALEISSNHGMRREAAAELRRLHAELDRCKTTCDATAECWRLDAEQWKAQRDALLEALKQIEPILARMYGSQAAELPPMQIVRAAIKAAEQESA